MLCCLELFSLKCIAARNNLKHFFLNIKSDVKNAHSRINNWDIYIFFNLYLRNIAISILSLYFIVYLPSLHLFEEEMHSFRCKSANYFMEGFQAGCLANMGEFLNVVN